MGSKVSGMAPHSLYTPQVIIALHLPSGNMCINSLFPKYFIHELAMGILSQRCSQKLKRSANFLQFLQYRFFCIVYLVDDAAWSAFSLHRIKRSTLLCLDTLTQLAQRRPKVAGFNCNLSQEQTQSTNPNAKACLAQCIFDYEINIACRLSFVIIRHHVTFCPLLGQERKNFCDLLIKPLLLGYVANGNS